MNDEGRTSAHPSATIAALSVPRVAPAVIVRLELEAAPQVICDFLHEGDQSRMYDWLDAHPELRDMVCRAFQLRNAA
jgi:hypothetical protein